MKKDGVRFEVCDYALKANGVDPTTILPEVNHVGNGFISIAGYQEKDNHRLPLIDETCERSIKERSLAAHYPNS
jgi:hypothetical protein